MLVSNELPLQTDFEKECRRVSGCGVRLFESPKSTKWVGCVERWVARLWNVREERLNNVQVKFTTTPFNARSSRFHGVPPRNLQAIGSKTKAGKETETNREGFVSRCCDNGLDRHDPAT